MRGLLHLYTGDGKGKTTAALGLALRFAGHGKRVILVQLGKGSDTGELRPLSVVPEITILRNSHDYGFWKNMTHAQKSACKAENNTNLALAASAVARGVCDLLILDELTSAYENDSVDRASVEKLISQKPEGLELVITGRSAPGFILQAADYITEMKCLRHPFNEGINAREGAEY